MVHTAKSVLSSGRSAWSKSTSRDRDRSGEPDISLSIELHTYLFTPHILLCPQVTARLIDQSIPTCRSSHLGFHNTHSPLSAGRSAWSKSASRETDGSGEPDLSLMIDLHTYLFTTHILLCPQVAAGSIDQSISICRSSHLPIHVKCLWGVFVWGVGCCSCRVCMSRGCCFRVKG